MNTVTLLFVLSCASCAFSFEIFGPIVNVPGVGRLQGIGNVTSHLLQRPYSVFRGVQYADPPVGDTRFKPSQPRAPYDEPLVHTVRYAPICPQGGFGYTWSDLGHLLNLTQKEVEVIMEEHEEEDRILDEFPAGKEDNCLVMDIHTPKLPSKTENVSMPVLVFMHGGGFVSGRLLFYWAKRFMDQDIVLVTIQYRLGALGFLCMQIPEAPGNAGLYDQLLALKWVNQHISYFGGDPNQVTISGQSAGSASVSYHLLSKLSAGLFHGIIAESGSSLSYWAYEQDPVYDGLRYANYAGCDTNDPAEAVACLKNMTSDEIVSSLDAFEGYDRRHGRMGFEAITPCAQDIAPEGYDKFISQSPTEILNQGTFNHVPILYGANRDEGSFVAGVMYGGFLEPNNLLNNSYFFNYLVMPTLLRCLGIEDPTGATADSFSNRYLEGLPIGKFETMMPGLVDMIGVLFLKASTYQTVKYNSYYNDSYFYSFDYMGGPSLFDLYFGQGFQERSGIIGGVTHGDELIYLYLPPFFFKLDDDQEMLSKKMIRMWTNFIYYGNPTPDDVDNDGLDLPKWEKYEVDNPHFLRIVGPYNLTVYQDYSKLWTIERDTFLHIADEINGN